MDRQIPAALGDRAYLVAYHVEKQKLVGGNRSDVVNAAVLVELWLAGTLTDENRRAVAVPAARSRFSGPEADVLRRIRESDPRRWKAWIRKDAGTTQRAVRDRLAGQRVIRVEARRLLGLFDRPKITVPDTRAVRELVRRCRAAVLDGGPVDVADPLDAALVALVAAAEWNTVFSGRERRAHRDRIAQFAERSGPAAKALRDVVSAEQSAAG